MELIIFFTIIIFLGEYDMPKFLSLLFAIIGVVCLSAMAISIAHSLKWVVIWGVLYIIIVGIGFMVRRKYNSRKDG
jgi:uncharacterized membrane protein YjfL (UPF0719 family)